MKARFFILAGLLLTLISLVIGAAAQDAEAPCVAADVLDVEYKGIIQRGWIKTMAVTLETTAEDDDMTNWLGAAGEMRRVLARLEADCRGLHFNSEVDGAQPVLGPIAFPNGIWRAVLTTEKYAIVKTEEISGKCESDYGVLFNSSPGDAIEGAEAIFKTSEGCEVLITIENARDGWDLIFEPIKLDE